MTDASTLITTDYSGNYIYENSVLQFFNTAEGYVEPNGTGLQYVYQYKDHLGNVRLSYADSNGDGVISPSFGGGQGEAEIREENNYYPFGLKHKGYNFVVNGRDHKYGFGNKEEQDELGLGWIDITARNYDPALGRWMNLDPLAEAMRRHSPYNYAFDNPVYFIDADGLAPSFFDEESKRQNEIDNDCSFRGKCGSRLDDGPVPDFVPDFDPSGPQNLTGNGGRKKPKKAPKEVRFSEGKALAVGDGTETVNTLEEVTVVGVEDGEGNDFSLPSHWIGPALIISGKKINFLKPVGALGSKPGSSLASFTLSKVIPYRSSLIKKATTSILGRRASTAVLGRALGRFVPVAGQILTTYDAATILLPHSDAFFGGPSKSFTGQDLNYTL